MSNAIKGTTSFNAAPRGLDIVSRLIASVLCLYLAVTAPFAYAIDPITGAWTANAAASAAFGGGVSGGAAAIQAAVTTAAGAAAPVVAAAAAAAAVAGAGVAAFCVTSYLYGNNSCGGGSAISGGLQAAGISVGPTGDLVFNPKGYFTTPYKGLNLKFNNATAACNAAVTISNIANFPSYHVLKQVKVFYASGGAAIGGADCVTTFTDPNRTNYYYDQTGRWVTYIITTTPQKAADEQVAEAVAKNPAAAAAAAAAVAQPSLAKAEAAATAATAAPRTPEAECAAKGMKHGTFNGAVLCVGVGTATDGTGAPAGETGTGTGTGTGTDTANPPTTGNPPVAGATPLPAFCVYAQTLCDWVLWTKEEPVKSAESANKVTIAESTESDVLPNFDIGQQRVVFTANCPASIPIHISMFGSSVNTSFSHQPLCEFMSNLRPFVIAAAYITGAYIIAGTGRGGGNDG